MSEFLYHTDPYRKEAETKVVASFEDAGRYFIGLADCLFYPQGGGQKGDRGFLLQSGLKIPVIDTVKDQYSNNGRPLLVCEKEYMELVVDSPVSAVLDWDRRYKQMRLHGIVHLHHCMMEKILGHRLPNPTTSDLQDDATAYNRYDTKEVTGDLVNKANGELENVIAAGAEVTTTDDPEKSGFRRWHCLGYSIPCGGTHVKDVAEIGKLEVSFSERKGKPKVSFRLAS